MPETAFVLGIFDGAIFQNETAFLIAVILIASVIGALSRSLALSSFSGLLILIHIQLETNLWIFDDLVYALVALFIVIMSLRIISYGLKGQGNDMP